MTGRSEPRITTSDLGLAVLSDLVEFAREGIAVIERDSARFYYVNPAGALLLGQSPAELMGGSAEVFAASLSRWTGPRTENPHPAEPAIIDIGEREVEYVSADVSAQGGPLVVVRFRDVTDARLQERRLQAFSRTSASIAFAGRLTTVLDRLAAEVQTDTGMIACTFLLMDPDGDLRQAGTSGDYPGVDDYAERLKACRALGAQLLSAEAFETRRPIVVEGWREQTLADSRFAPLHEISRAANWHTIAVVPLVVRGRITGVLNGYYLRGHTPTEADIAFLAAIADQAAVAVENARLLSELENKVTLEERHRLARDLHDSVSQALFSLTLRTRAIELALDADRPDVASAMAGLADVRDLTRDALAEMRALIFQLRPDALHDEGLVEALRRHAAGVEAKEDLRVLVVAADDELPLAMITERHLFRVVQESLNNVVNHARATTVIIRVERKGNDLVLEIEDNGCGFEADADHPGHLGLRSMAERVAQLGGTFVVRSSPGAATTVQTVVPEAFAIRGCKEGRPHA